MENSFRFKRFLVRNERSAMKVNTDGVLLGAVVPVCNTDCRVLDIGTGTGVIALMLAQRLTADTGQASRMLPLRILGIDIDPDAAAEAADNFASSEWAEALTSEEISLESLEVRLAGAASEAFDIIVSNPPYYDSSLTNPDGKKAVARHTDLPQGSLSYRDVMEFAARYLSETGRLSVVLPSDQEFAALRYARMCGLHLSHLLRVRTVERKQPKRFIATFVTAPCECLHQMLTIMEKGKYTDEYISLVKDFYLFG